MHSVDVLGMLGISLSFPIPFDGCLFLMALCGSVCCKQLGAQSPQNIRREQAVGRKLFLEKVERAGSKKSCLKDAWRKLERLK